MDKIKLLQICFKKKIFLKPIEKEKFYKDLDYANMLMNNLDENLIIKFCYYISSEDNIIRETNEIQKKTETNKVKEFHDILFDNDEFVYVNHTRIIYSIENYFDLYYLINKNSLLNYKYNIEFIININEKNKIEEKKLKKLIVSKILLVIIKNFLEDDDISLSDSVKAKAIEQENNQIAINSEILKDYNYPNSDNEQSKVRELQKIYNNIIIYLIQNRKFEKFKYTSEILNQLDLENINVGKEVINFIINNINKDYINDNIIRHTNDFNEKKIINFNYFLLKYIIKNPINIYNIPFLLDTRAIIIKIIKINKNLDYSIYSTDKILPKFEKRKDYIVKFITDLDYYYEKYLSKKKEIIISFYNPNNQYSSDDIYIIYHILYESSFIMTVKGNIINYEIQNLGYDFNITFEELIKKKEDILKNHNQELDLELFQNFIKLMEFLSKIKKIILDSNKNKVNFDITLDFSREKYDIKIEEKQEKKPKEKEIYDLKCIYSFYSEKEKIKLYFRDERILNNEIIEYYPGISYLSINLLQEFNY